MLLSEKIQMLQSTDLFRNMPEQGLNDLANIMEVVTVEKNTELFHKGDPGDKMFMLVSGSVDIYEDDHIFAQLHDGEFFGELSLLDGEPRSASVTATSNCVMLQLRRDPFYEAISKHPAVLSGIVHTLCKRIRLLNDENAKMSRKLMV